MAAENGENNDKYSQHNLSDLEGEDQLNVKGSFKFSGKLV